jgi:hypothetical protein
MRKNVTCFTDYSGHEVNVSLYFEYLKQMTDMNIFWTQAQNHKKKKKMTHVKSTDKKELMNTSVE